MELLNHGGQESSSPRLVPEVRGGEGTLPAPSPGELLTFKVRAPGPPGSRGQAGRARRLEGQPAEPGVWLGPRRGGLPGREVAG